MNRSCDRFFCSARLRRGSDDFSDTIGPRLQRFTLLVLIGVPIVNRGDTGDDTGFVVEHGLNHLWLNSKHGHIRCDRAAQVVNAPILSFCPKGRV